MSFISSSNSKNVISFCGNRLDSWAANQIMQKHPEGVDSSTIETDLQSGNYIEVLSSVWGEKTPEKRLGFLRKHETEFHGPLLYEQAITEFRVEPTLQKVIDISVPLLMLASSRVYQDQKCSADPSVSNGDAFFRMGNVYFPSLENAIKRYAPELGSLDLIQSENEEFILTETIAKLTVVTEKILNNPENLPSPNWIGYHGMDCYITGGSNMLPETEFAKKRKEAAQEFLDKFTSLEVIKKT